MSDTPRPLLETLLEKLGGHPVSALGLDLERPGDIERWFIAACLLSSRAAEERALGAARALSEAGLGDSAPLATADPERVYALLVAERVPAPDVIAGRLIRTAAALRGLPDDSLTALAAASDGLEDLGARLAGLAPGVGTGTIVRFLRPLRDRWPAAREIPLARTARAAAVHLGLLGETEDEEGEPGALRAALGGSIDPAGFADVEAALERLGARSCARGTPERCALGALCPEAARRARS
jgi:hypothetical protein